MELLFKLDILNGKRLIVLCWLVNLEQTFGLLLCIFFFFIEILGRDIEILYWIHRFCKIKLELLIIVLFAISQVFLFLNLLYSNVDLLAEIGPIFPDFLDGSGILNPVKEGGRLDFE